MQLRNLISLFVFILLIVFISSSCNDCVRGEGESITRKLDIPSFSAITISGSTGVTISQGVEQKVEITAPENIISLLNTSVNDNTWDVSFVECIRSRTLEINITVPSLNAITVLGSGDVKGTNNINVEQMNITVTGSGNVDLILNSIKLVSSIKGSGNIRLTGSATNHSITVSGSGNVDAEEFPTVRTQVQIIGSGDAKVNASEQIEATVKGSGNIEYKDTGARIVSDIQGSGNIVRK
jgi:hypothetical protein